MSNSKFDFIKSSAELLAKESKTFSDNLESLTVEINDTEIFGLLFRSYTCLESVKKRLNKLVKLERKNG